jgi:hypothetical protein
MTRSVPQARDRCVELRHELALVHLKSILNKDSSASRCIRKDDSRDGADRLLRKDGNPVLGIQKRASEYLLAAVS